MDFFWIIRNIRAMYSAKIFVVCLIWAMSSVQDLVFEVSGSVPAGRASADYAKLQNILRMVPLRVLRIPRAYFTKLLRLEIGIDSFNFHKNKKP